MKQTFSLLLILITYQFSFGQGKTQGYVLDASTKEPLPYATIGAVNKNYGCYTDTSGFFTLYFSEQKDSIKISFIGYADINTTIKNLLLDSQILLKPSFQDIEEVIIRSVKAKYKNIDIGYFSKKYNSLHVLGYPVNIYSIYIPFPDGENELIIESINIAYCNSQLTDNCPIRAQILKVDKNGKPGEVILSKNIETANSKYFRLKKATVEITDENIYLPKNGIYVAIEWIFNFKPNNKEYARKEFGPYIGTTRTEQSNINYLKVYNQPEWHEISSKNILNIGLTVKKYN